MSAAAPVSRSLGRAPLVSVICPAFNEETGIAAAVTQLKKCLDELPYDVEVIIVNDGSTDATVPRALHAVAEDTRFRILSHRANFGRGRALRTGFAEARGAIIVTTEGDLSWGSDVVGRMVQKLLDVPELDAVFASPNIEGGGYRNVPWHRVLISRIGNRILRLLYLGRLTMTTGMTRAYRAWVVQGQYFSRDGKELHLEIAHRLLKLGHRIGEVPAILSWPVKGAGPSRGKRTNWGKIFGLVFSHLSFGFYQGASRLIWPGIVFLTLAIPFFGIWGLVNLFRQQPSILLATLTGVLTILWVTLIVGHFLLRHVLQIEIELFRTQEMLAAMRNPSAARDYQRGYYAEVTMDARETE
jgi:glycosyltransferase involved in cell wall biosynthesis